MCCFRFVDVTYACTSATRFHTRAIAWLLLVTTEFVNKHWVVNTSSRMTLRLISLIPSISARTSYSWISLYPPNLIMFDFEICPVCQKPFTDSVKPKRSCYKHLTTSRDNNHKKFCSDLRETHSEAAKQRTRNLNRQRQQQWWRKTREEVKSRTGRRKLPSPW